LYGAYQPFTRASNNDFDALGSNVVPLVVIATLRIVRDCVGPLR
jgi:hypothetical protein